MVPGEENLPELLTRATLPSLPPSKKKKKKIHAMEENILITDLFVIGED